MHTRVIICSLYTKVSNCKKGAWKIVDCLNVVMCCWLGAIALVHTKVNSYNSAKKCLDCRSANTNCLLQVMHTKAVAALTQFAIFFLSRIPIILLVSTKVMLQLKFAYEILTWGLRLLKFSIFQPKKCSLFLSIAKPHNKICMWNSDLRLPKFSIFQPK